MTQISQLAKNIVPSMTVEMKARITEMKAEGIEVISLTSGEPDFPTPENIVDAAIRALKDGHTKYTASSGIMPLRKAICEKLEKENGIACKPSQICVSTGAKQAIFNTLLAVCDPGDEVILPTPCWVSYTEQVKMAGAVPVLAEMDPKKGYCLEADKIEKVITPRSKLIIINSPNNPTGAVYSKKELLELAEVAEKYGLYVISDEIYEKLIYGTAEFVSFPGLTDYTKKHTILINGFSKSYSMTGWRIGYSAAPADIAKAIGSIQGHTTNNANSIAQYAALEALIGPQDSVEMMRQEFDRRRKFIIPELNQIPGVVCEDAAGAFYALPDISFYYGKQYGGRRIMDSLDMCNFLLEEAQVGLIPGDSFYAPGHIRISYASSMDELKRGLERIKKAFQLLNK